MKKLILTALLMLAPMLEQELQAMSMLPHETRYLNTATGTFTVDYTREDGTAMTRQDYADKVNVYVNGALYPYELPAIPNKAEPQTFIIYTFDEIIDVNLTLKDTAGRESSYSSTVHWNFTKPTAPTQTCTP